MKFASGPKTPAFKVIRLLFFLVLFITVALVIWAAMQTIYSFKRVGEWASDTPQSQTYEQVHIVNDLRVVAVVAAITLAFGFTNIVFGFLGAITLWIGPLIIFALLDAIILILIAVVIAFEDKPDLSIGWLCLNIVRLLLAILVIREVKIHNDEIVRRRVMEKEVSEH
jgi:hypothetical protein